MARGNLFFVCMKSLSDFEYYDENSFDWETCASLGIKYFEALGTEACKHSTNELFKQLKACGFDVNRAGSKDALTAFSNSEDGDVYSKSEFKEICAFVLFTGLKRDCDTARRAYFREALDKLKEKVSALTLDEFAGTEEFSSSSITRIVDNDFSDVVHVEEGKFMSLDTFIRSLQPERAYFFGAKVQKMQMQ